jgi:hypothetical protein
MRAQRPLPGVAGAPALQLQHTHRWLDRSGCAITGVRATWPSARATARRMRC